MLVLNAVDVDTLSVETVGDENFIRVVDHENMTSQRINKLRLLRQERAQKTLSVPLDLDELDRKLGNHSQDQESQSDRSPTPPDYTPEQLLHFGRDILRTLEELGGRPAAPLQTYPRLWLTNCCNVDETACNEWCRHRWRTWDECERWFWFRYYQLWIRDDSDRYQRYTDLLGRHMKEHGIPWGTHLLAYDVSQQSALDLWREYYLYEHRALTADEQCRIDDTRSKQWCEVDLGLNFRWLGLGSFGDIDKRIKNRRWLVGWIQEQLSEIALEDHYPGQETPKSHAAPSPSSEFRGSNLNQMNISMSRDGLTDSELGYNIRGYKIEEIELKRSAADIIKALPRLLPRRFHRALERRMREDGISGDQRTADLNILKPKTLKRKHSEAQPHYANEPNAEEVHSKKVDVKTSEAVESLVAEKAPKKRRKRTIPQQKSEQKLSTDQNQPRSKRRAAPTTLRRSARIRNRNLGIEAISAAL